MKIAEFLASVPPGIEKQIEDLGLRGATDWYRIVFPSVMLYCPVSICNGLLIFDTENGSQSLPYNRFGDFFLNYYCRHCKTSRKDFALRVRIIDANGIGEATKFGEMPSFGEPIPTKTVTLIGGERELFLKGKRAEDQGLGIAAFAYYRRVVENQKNRIIDEILKVCRHVGASELMTKQLEEAKTETQFTRAVEIIKGGIPDVLKIKGHNPLTLLHAPLSKGLHELSDGECLELATNIRLVLNGLAERIEQAMKDEAEMAHAVSRLLQIRSKKGEG